MKGQAFSYNALELMPICRKGEKMLVYTVLIMTLVYLLNRDKRERIKIKSILIYLMPYPEEKVDWILGGLQLFLIGCISLLRAIKALNVESSILIFIFTFLSITWTIRLAVSIAGWLKTEAAYITGDLAFTLLVPILMILSMKELKGILEIRGCFIVLILSLCMVYRALLQVTEDQKVVRDSEHKLRSIVLWLIVILLNLYTLMLFIQFHWPGEGYHFIKAYRLDQSAAIDLFYYLIVTFTTVGLGDIQPHTEIAKCMTIMIALSGMFFTGVFVSLILSKKDS